MILVPVITLVKIFPYAQFGISIGTVDVGFVSVSYLDLILFALFLVGSISDFIDGHIARSRGLVTTFGKFIDPIADKALTTTMFVLLACDGRVPAVIVCIFLWRDISVDGMRMIAAQKGVVVAAGKMGKWKTATQMVSICLILLNNLPFELVGIPMADILLWMAAFLSVASGIQYFNQMKPYLLESK